MCGVFGITGQEEASNLTYLGLYAMQHRGQEAAGIVSSNGERLFKIRKRHLVSEAFTKDSFRYLKGSMAIGHVRYSTTGDNIQRNVQPFIASGNFGTLAVAHNGNLTNFSKLKAKLQNEGAVFQSTMDTEAIVHLVAQAKEKTLPEKIITALQALEGAFSLVFLSEKELVVARDPMGFRPLCLGRLGNSPVVASETCVFDLINAKYERDVNPGEMLILREDGSVESKIFAQERKPSFCIFEHIYFSRPDSMVFGSCVYENRKRLGHELARECNVDADFVMPVPDSGSIIALGYSEESRIPLQMAFVRNHYVGRTFIEPEQSIRGFGVKIKLNPVRSLLKGKRVIVIDDSIVRGTTSKKIIKMIRDAGAKEVNLLIASPPFVSPCLYGVDTPTQEELISSSNSVDATRKHIGADRLYYLSLEGMYRAVKDQTATNFCDACFTRKYPTQVNL